MRLLFILVTLLVAASFSHDLVKRQVRVGRRNHVLSRPSPSLNEVVESPRRIVCYYTNWSVYRKGLAKYTPQNMNPYLCTHLIYAFGGLTDEFGVGPFDSYQDLEQGGYAQFNGLKQYNRDMKTLLAIGGWNEGSSRFSELVSYKDLRENFTASAIQHLRRYNFDGLDLDWEYPGSREGSTPEDKGNYATLVEELREAFEYEASKSKKPRLLLTMAVPAGQKYIDNGYDVPRLDRALDFYNLLTYDYHSTFEPTVNHHAALFAPPAVSEFEVNAKLNVDWTIRYYLKKGASKDKLVVGIPTYGRSYTLLEPDFFGFQASADGPGEKGNYTNEKGYLAFYEICEAVSTKGWEMRKPYPKRMGPFAFHANQWVGYDDEKAVVRKAKYVRDNGLGGVMFWTVDSDDFRGLCNGQQYPLIEASKAELLKGAVKKIPRITTTTQQSVRRRPGSRTIVSVDPFNTPEPPTTPSSVKGFDCKREGFYPNPDNCRKYYWCLDASSSGLGFVAHSFTCPADLIFSKSIKGCDHPNRAKCKVGDHKRGSERGGTTTPATAFPTTTEFAILQEDYDYYYDVAEDAIDPILNVVLESPLDNVIEQKKQDRPVEQKINIASSDRGTVTPSRSPSRERSRPQYSSVSRDGPTSQAVAEEPIADPPSSRRQKRPQYQTIERQRPSIGSPIAGEQDQNLLHSEDTFGFTPQSVDGLTYVTIHRDRTATEASVDLLTEEENSQQKPAGGLQYVTLRRQTPSTTESNFLSPSDYENIADYIAEAELDVPTTTTTTKRPVKIRIPTRRPPQQTAPRRRLKERQRQRESVRNKLESQAQNEKEPQTEVEVTITPLQPSLRRPSPSQVDKATRLSDRRRTRLGQRTTENPTTEPEEVQIVTEIPTEPTQTEEIKEIKETVIDTFEATIPPPQLPDTPEEEIIDVETSTVAEVVETTPISETKLKGNSVLEETFLLFQQNTQPTTTTTSTTTSTTTTEEATQPTRRVVSRRPTSPITPLPPPPTTSTVPARRTARPPSVLRTRRPPPKRPSLRLRPNVRTMTTTTLSPPEEKTVQQKSTQQVTEIEDKTERSPFSFIDDLANARNTSSVTEEPRRDFRHRLRPQPVTVETETAQPTERTEEIRTSIQTSRPETPVPFSFFTTSTEKPIVRTSKTQTKPITDKPESTQPETTSTFTQTTRRSRERQLTQPTERSTPKLIPRTITQKPKPSTIPTRRFKPRSSTTPRPTKPFIKQEYEYVYDYEYYDGALTGQLGDLAALTKKASLLPDGTINCRDTGYFPHPYDCKKFISCSKTVRGVLRGWVYTCPEQLVFDPVGGMCNWTERTDCVKNPV